MKATTKSALASAVLSMVTCARYHESKPSATDAEREENWMSALAYWRAAAIIENVAGAVESGDATVVEIGKS